MAEATETKSSKTNLRWFLALLITLLIFAVISPAIVGAFQNLKKPSGT